MSEQFRNILLSSDGLVGMSIVYMTVKSLTLWNITNIIHMTSVRRILHMICFNKVRDEDSELFITALPIQLYVRLVILLTRGRLQVSSIKLF